ncbi:MAG: hypothetical protein HY660_16695 [Armatimonadetes bacterium]|nr:hypothetical protein [Armatimonadota bacterium]
MTDEELMGVVQRFVERVRAGESVPPRKFLNDCGWTPASPHEAVEVPLLLQVAAAHASVLGEEKLDRPSLTRLRQEGVLLEELLRPVAEGIVRSRVGLVHPSDMDGLCRTMSERTEGAIREWTGPDPKESLWG